MQLSIDEHHNELYLRGWSVGEVQVRSVAGQVWMVHAHDGDQQVVAKAPSQAEAWHEAVLLIRRLASAE